MPTLKWIEENYSYDDILEAGPETETVERVIDPFEFANLQMLVDFLSKENIDLSRVSFRDYESLSYFETVTLSELSRFKKGRKILQEKENQKTAEKKKEERELRELERLKKKYNA